MSATRVLHARMAERPHVPVAVLAVLAAAVTVTMAYALDLPLRDPDGVAGPSYIRLPGILLIMFALDVLPRAAIRARGPRAFGRAAAEVVAERWSRSRAWKVLVGLLSFYLTYVAYRNVKSFLPFARDGVEDSSLLELDRAMTLGAEPSDVLHAVLGTGLSAQLLSIVYVVFLIFVPISLGAALVWSRNLRHGYWYVTAMCLCWVLGALSYYLIPSLGPVFVRPDLFSDLPVTAVSQLQDTLWSHRVEVLRDPHATAEVHGIAGFASLHVAITLCAALVAQLLRLHRVVRWGLWIFFGLTVVSTLYFGWHYIIDDIAGAAIAAVAVWLGALATGHRIDGLVARPRLAGTSATA